jgi:Inorganic pyrophosphatase/exopolyphosphatase
MIQVYCIGHRQPDTDSIASAIGYADFKNRSEPGRYVAARCGELNAESRFALERFGAKEPPVLVASVEPRLSDITYKPVFALPENVPTYDVAALMAKEGLRNVVITDAEGKPTGMIGEHALANAYIETLHLAELAVNPVPVETLARVLQAQVVVSAHPVLEGRVYIAIDALHVTLAKMTAKDIAVVGDNEPAQLALVSAGIAALIIAEGAPVGERVKAAARQHGVSVLSTGLDAFGVGKMINLSLPAKERMETSVPILGCSETIAKARQVVAGSKFRAACVISPEGKLLGILTRTTLLDDVRRQVVLLDHNEGIAGGAGHRRGGRDRDHRPPPPRGDHDPKANPVRERAGRGYLDHRCPDVHGVRPCPVKRSGGRAPLRHPLRHACAADVHHHPPGQKSRGVPCKDRGRRL